ncbi:Pycsar system effector family protein [Faecalibacter macacae]|uniref:Pycsar system effector family protein n=1 Tax=Faecalibacter macacae TaxID=1859289 RepID=UPI00269E5C71|nr:Pycsar system effector family protein [Faecalibacter macacae]
MINQLQKVENYVFNLFKDNLSFDYTYHNFMHTTMVVEAAKTLINKYDLNENQTQNIIMAAWLHDTGYTLSINEHEKHSAEIAKRYLTENLFSDESINEILGLILTTELKYVPQSISESIIRDADSFHLGHTDYNKFAELLRIEIKKVYQKEFSDFEWHQENRNFFINHHRYYTDAAKELWQNQKDINLMSIQSKINEIELVGESLNKYELKKKKNDKAQQMDRGVDTLFRVTLSNHTRLSDIADSKANILLSVNAIIISIALSTLIPKLSAPKNEYLIIPSCVLLVASVASIIFAILSTKPNVTYENFTEEDLQKRKVNLLFFGNFYQMSLDSYEEAMNELMKDRDYVYNSLTRDLYYLGKVLERKYRLLSVTYTIFMIGTILSVLAFGIALFMNN